ncbi:hypothetical protein DMUE_4283 [Dictyocoela muelleri]|nr:hypothetical protein DMUE_4283 [Dictyocoela muelleri]
MVGFCCEESIEMLKKYTEETWCDYFKRVLSFGELKNLNNDVILKKLKNSSFPQELHMIIFNPSLDTKKMLELLLEYEECNVKKNTSFKGKEPSSLCENIQENMRYPSKKTIKCFNCGKIGHKAKFCYLKQINSGKKENINMCSYSGKLKDVDNKEVEINGFKYFSVFDSGSSVNIVSSNMGFLKNKSIEYDKSPLTIKLINGTKVKLYKKSVLK